MNRLEANRKLLEILKVLVETYPEWRFGQILNNAEFVKCMIEPSSSPGTWPKLRWENEFYTESDDLLKRVKTNFLVGDKS